MQKEIDMNHISDIKRFLLAGKAILTIKSEKSGKHFTYLVETSDPGDIIFVKVLTGPDNLRDYTYIGYSYVHKAADGSMIGPLRFGSRGQPDHPASVAWMWAAERGFDHNGLTVQHIGRCAACGRPLTTPDSLTLGIGPECAKRVV